MTDGAFNAYPPAAGGGEDVKCYKEVSASSVFKVTGGYDPQRLTPEMCVEACAKLNDPAINTAAITEGSICLCGKEATGKQRTTLITVFFLEPHNCYHYMCAW